MLVCHQLTEICRFPQTRFIEDRIHRKEAILPPLIEPLDVAETSAVLTRLHKKLSGSASWRNGTLIFEEQELALHPVVIELLNHLFPLGGKLMGLSLAALHNDLL